MVDAAPAHHSRVSTGGTDGLSGEAASAHFLKIKFFLSFRYSEARLFFPMKWVPDSQALLQPRGGGV